MKTQIKIYSIIGFFTFNILTMKLLLSFIYFISGGEFINMFFNGGNTFIAFMLSVLLTGILFLIESDKTNKQ